MKAIDRFERKIEKVSESGCWIWTSNIKGKGYGVLSFGTPPNRKWRLAHRLSWELYIGKIPDGLDVLHKCDVPCCVNPKHLFLGKDVDNVHDSIKKGRWITHLRQEGWRRMSETRRRLKLQLAS